MSRIRANTITNKAATGAPTFSNGAVVTGVCTATSFVGSGAVLTGVSAGKILQVKTLTWLAGGGSGTGDTFHAVASGNLQITPSAANSKFLLIITGVNGHANMGGSSKLVGMLLAVADDLTINCIH